MLSHASIAPQVAQKAMRHADIQLTIQNFIDPILLHVAGAVAKLQTMESDQEKLQATGTNDTKNIDSSVAPDLVFHCTFGTNLSQIGQSDDRPKTSDESLETNQKTLVS